MNCRAAAGEQCNDLLPPKIIRQSQTALDLKKSVSLTQPWIYLFLIQLHDMSCNPCKSKNEPGLNPNKILFLMYGQFWEKN